MIEEAECVLRDLGFYDVRVRHHELKSGNLARIEIGQDEMAKLFSKGVFPQVAAALKKLGYGHVTLDLAGYRRGSMNIPFKTAVKSS